MILSFTAITLFSLIIEAPVLSVDTIRDNFHSMELNEKNVENMINSINNNTEHELLAYRGVCKTMMAKYVFWPASKIEYFNDGKEDIENAIQNNPENIEIRYLRLLIQLNTPNFLGYNDNIDDDATVFLDQIQDSNYELQWKIKFIDSILSSKNISEEQRAKFVQTKILLKWRN